MEHPPSVCGLTVSGCRSRQNRLREQCESLQLDAALITDPRHVYYFTGYWGRSLFAPTVLIKSSGEAILASPFPPQSEMAAQEIVVYESNQIGTLVDNQDVAAVSVIQDHCRGLRRIGCDRPVRSWLLPDVARPMP